MIIVGEKINASIPAVKKIIESRDQEGLCSLARKQVDAGAQYIDVNVATGIGDQETEIEAMEWAINVLQDEIETPLCIDSADPFVIEAGLKARGNRKSLINSTNNEKERLEKVVPLAVEYDSPLIALVMGEQGIPQTEGERIEIAAEMVGFMEKSGLKLDQVYFDPLVIPISTDNTQALVTLNTLSRLKNEFPSASTVMGLSNVSYGLPGRSALNAGFMIMAMLKGLDAAVMDPLDQGLMNSVKIANALLGRDRYCRRYLRAFRK
ncbi:MAG: dihydropteroate synthase [Deltaproteobacteria bacterium]|nr:dihydropteroate synthase [Deltaproteobacteria bacterium]MBW2085316.1 dihydropteroate synthase [Deltaproteobacteria bacterium]